MSVAEPEKRTPSKHAIWSWTPLLIPLALAAFGVVRYGSVRAAFAAMNGRAILVDAETKSFGVATEDETATVTFIVSNLSAKPIRLLGSYTSCSCTVPDALPVRIEPKRSHRLRVNIHMPAPSRAAQGRRFRQEIQVFTNVPSQSRLTLFVEGDVQDKPAEDAAG